MKRFLTFAFGASILLLASTAIKADPITFTAILQGSQEVPPVSSIGAGMGTVTLDGNLLTVSMTFKDLTGLTTDSHIHCCAPVGQNAIVAIGFTPAGFPLGVNTGSFSHTFDLNDQSIYNPAFITAHGGNVTQARDDFIAALMGGQAYLNIHTDFSRPGEIRGQIVPEPATMLLLGSGLALVGAVVRMKMKGQRPQDG